MKIRAHYICKSILTLSVILIAQIVYAQDSLLIDKLLNEFQNKSIKINRDFISWEVLPGDSTNTVVLIPEVVLEEDDYLEMDSHIFIISSITGEVKARYYESHKTNGWDSSAMMLQSISIDSTHFQLSDSGSYFGVKTYHVGSSRVNPFEEEILSIFELKDDKIHPIIDKLETYIYEGEWDGHSNGKFYEVFQSIEVMSSSENGYYDIKVNISSDDTIIDNNALKAGKNVTQFYSEESEYFKFDGTSYIEVE